MHIPCDLCGQIFEDALLQILEQADQILYVCPDCFVQSQGHPPDEQA